MTGKTLFLIDVDLNKPSAFLIRQLNMAGIAGVIYLALGSLVAATEYVLFISDEMLFGSGVYVFVKAGLLVTVIFFLRGFILIGGLFDNVLLRVVAVVLIGAHALIIVYDLASFFYDPLKSEDVTTWVLLTFGCINIAFGVAVNRLDKSLGKVAEFAGILEIMSAGFFLTVFLSFMGLIVQMPAVLLEIILIFKAIELIKVKHSGNRAASMPY
jgi:hypothetical protein